jgi:proline iminopeptidase
MYQSATGLAALYPDQWEKYVAPIPNEERRDMVRAYYRRLTGDNAKTLIRAARAWALWEGATSYLLPNAGEIALARGASFARALARIECHYFFHRCFFRRDGQLLDEVSRIRNIPAVIVHGRYDVICPTRSAWDLHRAWPEAEFRIVADAGHSAFESGTARELVRATNKFASLR